MQQQCLNHGSGHPAPVMQRRKHLNSRRIRPTCHALLMETTLDRQGSVVLPPSLANNVVVLDAPNPDAPEGKTRVYLLGMSHVSKASVQQVKDLVRAVRPDVVGVELCRDRLPLLVDPDLDQTNLMWHCRRISVEGLPGASEWPQWEQIRTLLTCKPGRPVTQQDIEGDVVTLLSTGLFRSVRPACQTAGYQEAPEFLVLSDDGAAEDAHAGAAPGVKVQPIPPLQAIKFIVQERSLPPITEMSVRVDSSLKAIENPEADLATICSETMAANQLNREGGQVPALTCLLKAKQSIAQLFTSAVVVTFSGVETGKVEVLVRMTRDTDPTFISGFEASATGGDGWGIEAFKPKKNLYKVSDKLYLPMEIIDAMRGQVRTVATAPVEDAPAHHNSHSDNGTSPSSSTPSITLTPPLTQYRPWTSEEVDQCKPPMFEGSAFNDTLGVILTGLYAKYQAQAARKLGLNPGAAWQAALQAATEVGSQQVVLIDRPTVVTERRLSDSLVAQTGVRMGAAAGLVLTTLIASIATDILPPSTELAGFAASLAAGLGLLWPIIGPLQEMKKLSEMTPEQIEDTVAIKQPIAGGDLTQPFKVYGEDALLDWPGAMGPVIRDRDSYMSRALAGAATGEAAFSPAFVRDVVDGQSVWRFMMPEEAPAAAAPAGLGDGAIKPLKGVRTVVGVVGSAHVPGMVREWQESLRAPGAVDSLLSP